MMLDENLRIMDVSNTSERFGIVVPRSSSKEDKDDDEQADLLLNDGSSSDNEASEDVISPSKEIKWFEQMVYHQILIDKSYAAANIEITPTNPKAELLLFLNYKHKPMPDLYEMVIPLKIMPKQVKDGKETDSYNIFLGNEVINNRTGFFYVGVAEVDPDEMYSSAESYLLTGITTNPNASYANYTAYESNYTLPGYKRNYTTDYRLDIYTSGCYFFDYKQSIWSGEGCYVKEANASITYCKCNHLTSFGSGFFVMPNTVDFSYVFANAGFADNVTIYMTIMITLIIYALLLIWARVQDKKDLEMLGASPLLDNEPNDKYLYEISVFTGDKEGASTDSKVFMILSGDEDETTVRALHDPKRKTFRKGEKDVFVMAVSAPLGKLNYLRIWHDNSGKGNMRSWFLSYVVVKDIQTKERYEFIANKWFAVEKSDGLVDRLLPVAGVDEATQFSHLFHQKSSKNLKDGHLWFSVFMRPPASRFTRCQRVSACMALLYLSMLVNAMWYQRVPPKPRSSALEVGPFALSPEQIGVGFFSNLIVFPPTFLIVFLFRRSKLRHLRKPRIQAALEKQGIKVHSHHPSTVSTPHKKASQVHSISSQGQIIRDNESQDSLDVNGLQLRDMDSKRGVGLLSLKLEKQTDKKKKKRSALLPYWCRYIAWGLCVFSILISVFFLWAYGIQFGDDKTRKWISSLIVSFFASILVTQPIKVFLTAIILSTLLKAPDSEVDEEEEDEEELSLDLAADEEWLHSLVSPMRTGKRGKKDRRKLYRPPNLTELEKAKLNRLKEIKMGTILKEIFSYLFFLWILIVLSYGNRDPNAYLMKQTIKSAIIEGSNSGESFEDVKTTTDLWSWTKNTLIPEIFVGRWYNKHQPYGLRGFMNDRVNRLMGFPVIRQVRIRPQSNCKVESGIASHLSSDRVHCRKFSSIIWEDRKNYGPEWIPIQPSIPSNAGDSSPSPTQLNRQKRNTSSSPSLDSLITNALLLSDEENMNMHSGKKNIRVSEESTTTFGDLLDNKNRMHEENSNGKVERKAQELGTSSTQEEEDVKYEKEDDSIDDKSIVTRIPGEDFVILNPSKSKKNEWMYRKTSELDGLPFWGLLDWYSGGGYLVPLKGTPKEITNHLEGLKNTSWIDSRTRVVFVEFAVYNPQVNLFAVVTIAAEFQPGGGVIPNHRIDVVRLMRYHQGFGLFVILCELTYVGFIIYFTIREIKTFRESGRDYFKSYWNWAEMLVVIFSYIGMVLYVYRVIITNRILKIFDRTKGNGYIKLQFVTSIDELFGYIIAFTIFIGILKFIRLLRFNKRMGVLYSTLNQCSKDLKSFCIVFCIVFFSFVQMFYLLFGLHMKDFGSFVNSAETTFGMMTGKFDFDSMVRASPFLGPVAFFVFVLIASIVLLNIFLTLIISAFETVKHDVMKQSNEYEIVDFMMKKMKELMGIDTSSGDRSVDAVKPSTGPTIEEQMGNVVNKVDDLLHFLDTFYFEGQLHKSASRQEGRNRVSSAFTRQRRYGWRGNKGGRRDSIVDEPDFDRSKSGAESQNWRKDGNSNNNLSLQAPKKSMRLKSHLPPSQRLENRNSTPILNWREIDNKNNIHEGGEE
jgi:hypothetical protein